MAHKKGAGSTKNGRDSNSKRLGIKIYWGSVRYHEGVFYHASGSLIYAMILMVEIIVYCKLLTSNEILLIV